MTYAGNYAARASIFDNGDIIEGDHVSSLYEELGPAPGSVLEGLAVPYRANTWWNVCRSFTSSATNTAGSLRLWPMLIGRATTFNRISVYVTAAGSASTVVRMGIYTSTTNGMPNTLVAGSETTQDGTVVNTSTVAGQTINVTLDPGRYYVGAVSQGSGTMPTTTRGDYGWLDINYANGTDFTNIMSVAAQVFLVSSVTGALPSTISGGSLGFGASGHSIGLRMA